MTLQDVFWIVSIAWILYQAWYKFNNRKKEVSRLLRTERLMDCSEV